MTTKHLTRLIDGLETSLPPFSRNPHAAWCKGVAQVVVSLHQKRPELANGAPVAKLIHVALSRRITGKWPVSALAELALSTSLSASDSIPWRALTELVAGSGLVTLTKRLISCIPSHTTTPLSRIQLLATAAAASHDAQLVDQLVAQAVTAKLVRDKYSDPELVQSQLLARPSTLDQFNLMHDIVQSNDFGPNSLGNARPGLRAHHFSSLALTLARNGHVEHAWTVLKWMQMVSNWGELSWALDAKVAHEIMQHMFRSGKYCETALVCQWLMECDVATEYHLEVGVRALHKMGKPESRTWIAQLYAAAVRVGIPLSIEFVTSMVKALMGRDRDGLKEAMHVVREMNYTVGFLPNEVLYSVLLKQAIRLGDKDIHQEIMSMVERQYHVQGHDASLPIPIAFTLLVDPHLYPHSLDIHQALAAVAAIHSAHEPRTLAIDHWSILMGATTNLPPDPSRLGAVDALHVLAASSVGGLTAVSFSPYVGATLSAVSRAGDHVLATRLIRGWVLGDSDAVKDTNWDPRAWPSPSLSATIKCKKNPVFPNPKVLSVCADALGYAGESTVLDALVNRIHTRRWKTDAHVWASVVEAWLRIGDGERAIQALTVDRERAGVRVVTGKLRGTVRSMVSRDAGRLGWMFNDRRVREVLSSSRSVEKP
ncbi:hypothetical protein BCR44DRAFT_1500570 [Catenaria anguillulae PL171]|uniref:Uncharacterized protein n=1 Tax=Catenaria anguillulae PL171 TaxID=765915 RepID=A0A1Y2HIE1_9FUNG|nr:hypothetical protein BCR44DRAFT_1500570 [Catenaria anguillulae PL171]